MRNIHFANFYGTRIALGFAAFALGLTACTPKIYVVDRQTVLEEEAAGHWPQFDKRLLDQSKAQAPTPFAKTPLSARRARLYNVLNGPLTEAAESATPQPR